MKAYDSDSVKNIALIGHAGSGKTTLAETMLYETGEIPRRGHVEDSNTMSDYHEIEHERGNSIMCTPLFAEWRGTKINLLDTPGYDDFVGDQISALWAAEAAVMVINGHYGVEVETDILWEYTNSMNKPVIFAVNQMDHEKADFDLCLEQLKSHFGDKVIPVQYPYNAGEGFDSIIDVLKMVMYKFPADGGKPEKLDIPESEKAKADEMHNALVEAVAINDDSLMELYFEKGELDEDEMRKGFREGLVHLDIFPVFCMSAKKNMGSGRLMGFIQNVVPCASETKPLPTQDGGEISISSNGDNTIFIYKTESEPHIGDLSYFKVIQGEIATGTEFINNKTGVTERINQLFVMQGKKREPVQKVGAGDIGATVKLKNTHTNNTLCAKGHDVALAPIQFPAPRIRTAITPAKQGDEEKMMHGLHQIQEQDPTLKLEQSQELKQIILHGQGELHFQILAWRLEHAYGVQVQFNKPRIPYRETIQKQVKSSYRHKKQSGGAGQFAEVYMLIEPYHEGMPKPDDLNVRGEEVVELEWGGKLVFLNCIVGGAIDTRFLPSIMKGIMEKMHDGPLTGSYVRDVRVSVYDGKMHPVDSNDMAFKTAGMMAFKEGFREASPKLLEPIYDVEVIVPEEMMGDVMGDLQTRRGLIMGMEAIGHKQKISAKVPLAELYKYSSTLRSLTQGRAKYNRSFAEYAVVPADIQSKLIEEHLEREAAAV